MPGLFFYSNFVGKLIVKPKAPVIKCSSKVGGCRNIAYIIDGS